jgi:hypothetical protein
MLLSKIMFADASAILLLPLSVLQRAGDVLEWTAKYASLLFMTILCFTEQIKADHYDKTLAAAIDFDKTFQMAQQSTTALQSQRKIISTIDDLLQDLNSKWQVLLPLEFEAAMYQHLHVPTSLVQANVDRLSTIISKAHSFSAQCRTYALFADIVLSSSHPQSHETNKTYTITRPLPLLTTASLLTKIITAARTLSDYDTIKASRWIRCLVQLCLGRHQGPQKISAIPIHQQTEEDQTPPLEIVENTVTQVSALARQSLQERSRKANSNGKNTSPSTIPPLYPAEELEWLSTTLFNLGIDFYVTTNTPYQQTERPSTIHPQAKKWTSTAVQIADVLADYPRDDGGDSGLLGRTLRAKIRDGLGWDI